MTSDRVMMKTSSVLKSRTSTACVFDAIIDASVTMPIEMSANGNCASFGPR